MDDRDDESDASGPAALMIALAVTVVWCAWFASQHRSAYRNFTAARVSAILEGEARLRNPHDPTNPWSALKWNAQHAAPPASR